MVNKVLIEFGQSAYRKVLKKKQQNAIISVDGIEEANIFYLKSINNQVSSCSSGF